MEQKINLLMNGHKRLFFITVTLFVFTLIGNLQNCSIKKTEKNNQKIIKEELSNLEKSLLTKIDSLEKINSELLSLIFEREGYRISRRMLYENNAIIRSAMRPDDLMNSYLQKEKELEDKIKKIK
jgi:hypothetical protein